MHPTLVVFGNIFKKSWDRSDRSYLTGVVGSCGFYLWLLTSTKMAQKINMHANTASNYTKFEYAAK